MKNKKIVFAGFTLLEIVLVVATISVVALVVLYSVSSTKSKSRYSVVNQEIEQLVTAAVLYHGKYGVFPTGSGPVNNWAAALPTIPANFSEFMSKVPTPSCPYWHYNIVQAPAGTGPVFVSVRKVMPGVLTAQLKAYRCIKGACSTVPSLATSTEIQNWSTKSLACS